MNFDILKLLVVAAALLYFNIRVAGSLKGSDRWLINIGLTLLLFASVLDYADGIRALDNVAIIGRNAPMHDTLEDQFGDIPGLAFFAFGAFRALLQKTKIQ